jgi:hypothetical protein
VEDSLTTWELRQMLLQMEVMRGKRLRQIKMTLDSSSSLWAQLELHSPLFRKRRVE